MLLLHTVLLQVKELEEAKDAAVKQLLEYQSALAALASQRLLGFGYEQQRVIEKIPVKRASAAAKAAKSPKQKVKKSLEQEAGVATEKQVAVDALNDVKPYQVRRAADTV